MKKCKNCEHFHVKFAPDAMNEGLAECKKHNLVVDLYGKQYKRQIERLICPKEEA